MKKKKIKRLPYNPYMAYYFLPLCLCLSLMEVSLKHTIRVQLDHMLKYYCGRCHITGKTSQKVGIL